MTWLILNFDDSHIIREVTGLVANTVNNTRIIAKTDNILLLSGGATHFVLWSFSFTYFA